VNPEQKRLAEIVGKLRKAKNKRQIEEQACELENVLRNQILSQCPIGY
jgi:hypothetical protein